MTGQTVVGVVYKEIRRPRSASIVNIDRMVDGTLAE